MKKLALVTMAALMLTVPIVGCNGPHILSNNVIDWSAEQYAETPWLWGNTFVYGLISMATGFAYMLDGFVNAYYFWAKDAQPFGDGKGTTFTHKVVAGKKK